MLDVSPSRRRPDGGPSNRDALSGLESNPPTPSGPGIRPATGEPISQGSLTLCVSPSGTFRVLLGLCVAITVLGLALQAMTRPFGGELLTPDSYVVQGLDLNGERNFPVWYQTMALAVCGLVLVAIGKAHHSLGSPRYGGYWAGLGIVFLLLSVDELTSIHERSMEPIRSALGIADGFLYFAWVIPAMVLLPAFAVVLKPFLGSLPPDTRTRLLIAGTVFVCGAVGFEMVGAYFFAGENESWAAYTISISFEESLEMVGVVLFLRALLMYVESHRGVLRVGSSG